MKNLHSNDNCTANISLQWLTCRQWRSKAKCCPGPTIKVSPFHPLKFAYKIFEWKFMFLANLKI